MTDRLACSLDMSAANIDFAADLVGSEDFTKILYAYIAMNAVGRIMLPRFGIETPAVIASERLLLLLLFLFLKEDGMNGEAT